MDLGEFLLGLLVTAVVFLIIQFWIIKHAVCVGMELRDHNRMMAAARAQQATVEEPTPQKPWKEYLRS
jgi:hypothetical protein